MRILCVAALLLVACKESDRPQPPTAEEAQQLNEAEDLLENMAANEEGPEQSPSPSNSTN